MKKKVIVKVLVIAEAWINEDIQGNQEIEGIEDIRDIREFEVLEVLN